MAASTTGSLEHGGGFTFTPPPFITSFTDLLSGAAGDMLADSPRGGVFPRAGGGNGGVPKFKSAQPPSLPIFSQPTTPMSPSSYFSIPAGLSPAELLDSPVLLTSAANILASPTTGAIPAAQRQFDWKRAADMIAASSNDFSFHTAAFNKQEETKSATTVASTMSNKQSSHNTTTHVAAGNNNNNNTSNNNSSSNSNHNNKQLEDGYNWRKYGQKQVKGSENPRSYYKCTYSSCTMKKKVERSILDGRITQIVYKGAHNHAKPLSTRRNSSSASSTASAGAAADDQQQQQQHSGAATPENSSVTFGDDDADNKSEDEPDAKRWKQEQHDGENDEGSSAGDTTTNHSNNSNKPVREPRLVVQTLSDIDILDDGFRWRKYGQKVVKGNPNPRSYYKCTTAGCPVRKHVERASHDARAVITTYEGKHNHDVPVGRGAASRAPPSAPPATTTTTTAWGHQQQQGQHQHQHPYTLEMLPSDNGHSGYGGGNAFQQQQRVVTKDEPRDDLFVDSLLLC